MSNWPFITPGIPDAWFERLPGIPMSECEVRLIMISHLRLKARSRLWDIGAGTGTIPVETGLICPQGRILAIERDAEVAELIKINCKKFAVTNVEVLLGNAPECLEQLVENPDRVCVEGGRSMPEILQYCWHRLVPQGRMVAIANSLENLYQISASFAQLQVRNVEIVQSAINRLETRGNRQVFAAVNPTFIISGEKLD
ncbi:MAG: precorrin-6Y C5,15-methyltransferase subunit CbiT [Pseudanabaenaceae cyanobacterium bins.68]|nr:precorrin-6Y C5,15-methyltransferase subunit CbiT [Pseudanabaenaceae cyanobacterium bins.68]